MAHITLDPTRRCAARLSGVEGFEVVLAAVLVSVAVLNALASRTASSVSWTWRSRTSTSSRRPRTGRARGDV